jgi:hypothetical protein
MSEDYFNSIPPLSVSTYITFLQISKKSTYMTHKTANAFDLSNKNLVTGLPIVKYVVLID